MPTTALPFSVTEFVNPATKSVSWRVVGTGAKNGRVRKNFSAARGGAAAAQAEADRLNADEIRTAQKLPPLRVVPARRLTESDVALIEGALEKTKDRWTVAEIVDAGVEALTLRPPAQLIEPLFQIWREGPARELGTRWRREVTAAVARLLRDHPTLTTTTWTQTLTRAWLDDLGVGGQSQANYRNRLHLFGRWLCERTGLPDNPAAGLWISRKKSADTEAPPSVFSVKQIEALLVAYTCDPQCRRGLGWLVECTFVGLRPENEAPHALWSEIDLKRGEQKVRGYKRGVKPRIVTLHPTALAWLKEFRKLWPAIERAEDAPKLAPYWKHLRRPAVVIANTWLRQHAPNEPAIVWDEDILRHTYASMRAAEGATMDDLALEMGTSVKVIYGHYRHTRPRREAIAFWELTPARIRALTSGAKR